MSEVVTTIKDGTGFSASINNFRTTADDFKFFEGTSDKFSAIDLIKNEFFIIQEAIAQDDSSAISIR